MWVGLSTGHRYRARWAGFTSPAWDWMTTGQARIASSDSYIYDVPLLSLILGGPRSVLYILPLTVTTPLDEEYLPLPVYNSTISFCTHSFKRELFTPTPAFQSPVIWKYVHKTRASQNTKTNASVKICMITAFLFSESVCVGGGYCIPDMSAYTNFMHVH